MPVHCRKSGYYRRPNLRAAVRLHIETLETRCLPSVTSWPGFLNPVPETEANDTLDQAQNLGDLSVVPRAEAIGTIGTTASDQADVDWYTFQLDRPASVTLTTPPAQPQGQAVTTLSLYNSDPNDFNDPYDPLGYRLLGQSDSADQAGGARINQRLAAGTYYVAVSGSGNHYFHPFLADSGAGGATGDYGLLITAADLGLGANNGPMVLAADPQPGALPGHSPFLIRVDVSEPLDPNTVTAGGTVQLLSNANGTFGDGHDQVVTLASVNLNSAGNELLIAPAAPLAPGFYKVVLAGNRNTNLQWLADLNGLALGTSGSQPTGADFSYTFDVLHNEDNAVAGNTADDTPAGAHQLGDLSKLDLLQIPGAIGDDASDPTPFNPANVHLYHFQISGSGHHAFLAEVFAGRIGSPLDPALSLFQAGSDGQLHLLAANDNTLNDTAATNGTTPLFNDPVLYAGLTEGDYYLAVSGTGNVPDPTQGLLPGTNGIFDPNVSHSGTGGFTTGPYVLNLHVQPDDVPPQVVSTTLSAGEVLNAPPTNLTVQFSKPINLQQAAFAAAQTNLDSVYVLGSNGTKYFPRLLSYDNTTQQAQFLMLDGLANGTYQLHISASGQYGLADFAGNPLEGNDRSGDYVVPFTVQGPVRGTNGNPLQWSDQEPNNSVSQAQVVGVLFPHELQAGVSLIRNASAGLSDTADYYQIQVLQSRDYILSLSGTNLPLGALPTVADANGNAIPTVPQGTAGGVRVSLDPGTYILGVRGWTPSQAPRVTYHLKVSLGPSQENPTPLTIGPAPAYRIALAFDPPAATPSTGPAQSPAPSSPPAPSAPPAPPAPTGGSSPSTPAPTTPASGQTPTTSQPPTNTASTPPPATAGSGPSTVASTPAPTVAPSTTSAPAPPTPVTPSPAVVATPAAPETSNVSPSPTPSLPVVSASPAPTSTPAQPAAPASSGATPPAPSPPARAGSSPVSVAAAPTVPTVSVPRVDIPVSAEAVANSGVLLIANYRITADASVFGAIPSEVLTSLSALPIGGVRGPIRNDVLVPSDRILVHSPEPQSSPEPQIRLTIVNQPSIRSESDPEPQRTTPADQNPTSSIRNSVPGNADASRPSSREPASQWTGSRSTLEGLWRRTLDDLFMNGPWQRRVSEWLEKLPASSPATAVEGEMVPENASENPEALDTALLRSGSNHAVGNSTPSWAYAGLLLGMGAVLAGDVRKRYAPPPAEAQRTEEV